MSDDLIDELNDHVRKTMDEHQEDGRKTLYAEVCSASAEGFDAMARQIGCSRAAMLDAFGHALSSPALRDLLLSEGPGFPAMAVKAREIDSDRRARGARS